MSTIIATTPSKHGALTLTNPPGHLRTLAFGAGRDSSGILAGWYEKGLQLVDPIHCIVFADTGCERPHTYEYIELMQIWLKEHGFPPINIVRKGGRVETLEENCLRMNMLPSLAYGFKGCSHKFKVEPQDKFYNNLPAAREVWAAGQLVIKMIGYEARETKRWEKAKKSDDKYEYEFPLVEWGWNTQECEDALVRVGLPIPKKSSCFFCPASTLPEIRELRDQYPLLFQRAIYMEANANLKSVKGLGRRFAWRDVDVIEQDMPEVLALPPCRACVDFAPDTSEDQYEDVL